ncbi:hypothetical protein K3495_g5185 [Podosphaera aphanis]|nr:hypothetical protein K3495_g5185 [Podosphaera aphanis]
MKPSYHDPCLLATTNGPSVFGLTALQVDGTLYLGTENFIALEDIKFKEANIKAKPVDIN